MRAHTYTLSVCMEIGIEAPNAHPISQAHTCPLADAVSTARSWGQYTMPVICLAVGSRYFITLPFFRFTTCHET